MKNKIITFAIGALATVFSTASVAAQEDSFYVNLNCSAKAKPKQPCGGTNSRSLKLFLSVSDTERAAGYREEVSYGGCYPTSSDNFGTIENVSKEGDDVFFEFQSRGELRNGGIPVVSKFNSGYEPKPMPAHLNLKTLTLTVDTKDVMWTYAKPDVLKCQPVH